MVSFGRRRWYYLDGVESFVSFRMASFGLFRLDGVMLKGLRLFEWYRLRHLDGVVWIFPVFVVICVQNFAAFLPFDSFMRRSDDAVIVGQKGMCTM